MKKLALAVMPVLAVSVVLGTTIAGSAPSGTSTVAGGPVTAVKVVRSSTGIGTEGGFGWEDVPGATTTIHVPSGSRAFIVARFFAESTCVKPNDTSESFCSLRILIGDKPAQPKEGFQFAFDSTNQGAEGSDSGESHAMEGSRGPLPAGTYTVKLQWGVHGAGFTTVTCASVCFFLDHWSFSVERVQVRSRG